ncbi:SCO family protein [Paracoccus aurantiacus]|uniref:SCO family protein n=1 Tax=Paracoccus aurantiacus TaxID=2599412 RepID=A0A5C6S696_9RHOB|nr:SCO family protein [Paracoccus aurantiacus]TXB69929.1 SCO family protein [Paracoccus aurantiacus]
MKTSHLLVAAALTGHFTLPAFGHDGPHEEPAPMKIGNATEAIKLPDISVTDQNGDSGGIVSRYADGGPVLVSFLYTNCTEVCLMTQATLSIVDEELAEAGESPLKILSITVDPVRDTPDALAAAARDMDASDRWDWLRASETDTPALLSAFGIDAGPIETHENVYFVGDMASGEFTRVTGDADPDALIALARAAD